MNRIIYNKLIRDKIPEIIDHSKRKYEVIVLPDDEFEVALRDKLVEEAQEAIRAENSELITELADLQEIIFALMKVHKIDPTEFEAIRLQRLKTRGGFEKRLKLLWTD